MSQIAVRLSESELRLLDQAVAKGAFATRAQAVRQGIRLLERELREAWIADSYREAYTDVPVSAEETRVLDAALELVLDAP